MNEHGQIANEKHEKKEFSDFCEQVLFRKFNEVLVFAGSCFELPLIYFLETVTDVDSIVYQRNVCAIEKHDETPKDFKGTVLNSRSDESHHGYARLYSETNNTPYTYALVPDQMPALSQVLLEKSEFATGLFPVSSYMGKWLTNFQGLYRDIVDAIWCPNWPKEANEWKFRERRTGWPFSCTVEEIVNNGCFLVAKPHVYDMDGQSVGNEWRFSFSEAELILIYTWDHVQMYIYHILRLIKSDVVKKCGGKKMTCLTTYHFKTLMLWACEEKPKEFWLPPNIKSSAEELLLIMIEWLVEKQCRNYFMPGNNMLDHLPDSHNFEREVQLLLDSVNIVDHYISSTIPLERIVHCERLKVNSMRIQIKLLFALQLEMGFCHVVDPSKPGRSMYEPSSAIKKSHLFRSNLGNLFKCLTIHRFLALLEDFEVKLDGMRQVEKTIERYFRKAYEEHIDGFTCVDISPMDNAHDIIAKLSRKNIDIKESSESITDKSQEAEAIICVANHFTRHEFCNCRSEPVEPSQVTHIAEMLLDIMDRQMVKPTLFHTAAYEANFYWTIFGEERNDIAIESHKRAWGICTKWLVYARSIENSFTFKIGCGCQGIPLIISNGWSMIFDKYIEVVLGFLSLVKAIASYSRSRSNDKLSNESTTASYVIVHVYPIDFLNYINCQCQVHLKNNNCGFDNIFNHETQNDIGRMFLCTALHISTKQFEQRL